MDTGNESDQQESGAPDKDGDDGQEYVDRSKIDFDPDDGLYTGTAVDGTSEIPGPHEQDGGDDASSGTGDEDQ